uniref:Uncharacterized protein n=1 Tax=Caenorhabditis tropicalis TaxID=1561998 RepID=A0A1I7SXJ2_9PELO
MTNMQHYMTRNRQEVTLSITEKSKKTIGNLVLKNVFSPVKKRVGRPRNLKTREFEKFPGSSAVSSARSSIEPENPHSGVMIAEKRKRKRDSEYSRKKSKNRRLNKSLFEIKKEIDSNVYDNPILYDIDSSTGIVSRMAHSQQHASI